MHFETLAKIAAIYEQIKQVDKEIQHLEKTAKHIVNTQTPIELHLFINRPQKQKGEAAYYMHGPFISPSITEMMMRRAFGMDSELPEVKPEPSARYENKIGHSTALRILELLLFEQRENRRALVAQLETYGIHS